SLLSRLCMCVRLCLSACLQVVVQQRLNEEVEVMALVNLPEKGHREDEVSQVTTNGGGPKAATPLIRLLPCDYLC
uniref:Uncharacterized protein n=1 Tax=Amphilophus citrinellus TaxID=61819 RepID=A0A3Q0RED8_AMPCI